MQLLKTALDHEKIVYDAVMLQKLEGFATLLHEWNGVHNLTGAKTVPVIIENIVDSLFPTTFMPTVKSLLDVGTGAGFPGMVLAMALPETEVVLSEPLKKRVAFLKYTALELGLNNIRVEAKRVEQVNHAPFGLITSRAVTDTKLLLDLTEHLSDASTAYLFYKGSRVFEEVEAVRYQLEYDIVQKNQRNYLFIKGKM